MPIAKMFGRLSIDTVAKTCNVDVCKARRANAEERKREKCDPVKISFLFVLSLFRDWPSVPAQVASNTGMHFAIIAYTAAERRACLRGGQRKTGGDSFSKEGISCPSGALIV